MGKLAVLIALGLIWGYPVFRTQIVVRNAEWAIGSAVGLFFSLPGERLHSPSQQQSFGGPVFLFALFVALQLPPLPIGLLRWLSPARVEIHHGLGTWLIHRLCERPAFGDDGSSDAGLTGFLRF